MNGLEAEFEIGSGEVDGPAMAATKELTKADVGELRIGGVGRWLGRGRGVAASRLRNLDISDEDRMWSVLTHRLANCICALTDSSSLTLCGVMTLAAIY